MHISRLRCPLSAIFPSLPSTFLPRYRYRAPSALLLIGVLTAPIQGGRGRCHPFFPFPLPLPSLLKRPHNKTSTPFRLRYPIVRCDISNLEKTHYMYLYIHFQLDFFFLLFRTLLQAKEQCLIGPYMHVWS